MEPGPQIETAMPASTLHRSVPAPPTVGRVVHYFEHDTAPPLAAMIVAVHDDTCVNLCVFRASGRPSCETLTSIVRRSGHHRRDVWDWPERV